MKKHSTKSRTILLCGDIHGNLPALEAVLHDTRTEPVDEIWNLGDITGYVPFPVGVIELLRRRQAINIIGNYDQKVLAFKNCQDQWKKGKRSDKYSAFEWNHKQLSGAARKFLESLPESIHVEIAGFDITLVHAGEGVDGPLITGETPSEYLEKVARVQKTDVLLFGHSHVPMVKRIGGKVFVNPGSVGIPDGDDLRASYAILTIAEDKVETYLRHVEYDVERVVRAMDAAGRSKPLISLFRTTVYKSSRRKSDSPASEKVLLDQVLALADKCDYEREHTEQVTRLALGIFDGLRALHGMARRRRFQLHCGALLHDIGWIEGQKGHHKTALRLVVEEPGLDFDHVERSIIGLIARYHRKALPKSGHRYMGGLAPQNRDAVEKLAAMLRIADGLDRTHTNAISEINCRFDDESIRIQCRAQGPATSEIDAATGKADLMRRAFDREVVIEIHR
ncbi:MAG: YfcE family phosphodiesterase [Phycisphaerales bacterium]|nr:MAG: YfcE family phosphodiesterase [Phycisphaerales bacterium]